LSDVTQTRARFKLEPAAIEARRARDDWPDELRRCVARLRELTEINRLRPDVERYRTIETPTLFVFGVCDRPRSSAPTAP
jgi:hypothetical protein